MSKSFLTCVCVFCFFISLKSNHIFESQSFGGNQEQNYIFSMHQDSFGYMWFGTWAGLIRFDGYEYNLFKPNPDNPSSLSNNCVTAIYQDQNMNLWIGTSGGGLVILTPDYLYGASLADPGKEKGFYFTYTHEPDNPHSISNNSINSIIEDNYGYLWIGTYGGGINRVNIQDSIHKLQFSSLFHKPDNQNIITHSQISSLAIDQYNRIWAGTNGGGIYIIKAHPDSLNLPFHTFNINNSPLTSNNINCLHKDSRDNLWIGTRNGLCMIPVSQSQMPESSNLLTFKTNKNNPNSISHNIIEKIITDKQNNLWIATANGLNKTKSPITKTINNPRDIHFTTIRKNEYNNLSGNYIISLFIDHSNILWSGTYKGLNKLNLHAKQFYSFDDNELIIDKRINTFASYSSESYWTGSEGGVLSHIEHNTASHYLVGNGHIRDLDRRSKELIMQEQTETLFPVGTASSVADFINVIRSDKQGQLWIGSVGLFLFNPQTLSQQYFRPDPNDPNTLNGWNVWDIHIDEEQNIWIGTTAGLELYKPGTGTFTLIYQDQDSNSMQRRSIYTILEDKNGNLWLGSEKGLLFISKEDKFNFPARITSYQDNPDAFSSISSNKIWTLLEDSGGNIWAGTEGGGLNKISIIEDSLVFTNYRVTDGLLSNSVSSVLEDRKGNIWIGTSAGLSRLMPENEQITNYTKDDGLISDIFQKNAGIHWKGFLLFGTYDGIVKFRPDSIFDNPSPPKVAFMQLKIANQPVRSNTLYNNRIILSRPLINTDKITLKHDERVLTFEFTGFHYENPEKITYAYRMQNFDDDWIYATAKQRSVNYNNMPPGRYQLQVKAANNDNLWSDPISLSIHVKPPFWLTWWAFSIYIILFISLLLLIRFITANRERLRANIKILEKEKKQQEEISQKDIEINQSKIRFFTNISHEFRTPLTLITGPVESLKKNTGKNTENYKKLDFIERNARHLIRLVNQILDFQKIEAAKLPAFPKKVELNSFLSGIFSSFEYVAQKHNITFSFHSENNKLYVWIDTDMIEKTLYNLLSNAFKFTPENGSIKLSLKTFNQISTSEKLTPNQHGIFYTEGFAEISIKDTGKGIAMQDISKIFDRYYQAEHSGNNHRKGSGIGLALAKEFVGLHKGEIKVSSSEGEETIFTIILPLGNKHFDPSQLIQEEHKNLLQKEIVSQDQDTIENNLLPDEKLNDDPFIIEDEKPIILVVEDNEDIKSYIQLTLEHDYTIILTGNGIEGFEKAQETIPDLIISDIMMPDMNGYEMCEKIRQDEKTSHIPIIMLTALASDSDKIKGLETGADDYLVKPFNTTELIVRIDNIIQRNAKIRSLVNQGLLHEKDITETQNKDKLFLEKASKLIEDHIADPNFNIEDFSTDLGLSRAQLYRKIKGLTGQTVSEFVRLIRLKRATKLLKETSLTISEIMYKVGFNSSSYFTKCFKSYFGISPTEYLNRKEK